MPLRQSFRYLTLLIFCSIANLTVNAQVSIGNDYPARFTSIGINEGLSQGFVPDIFQDDEGFMWFATKDFLTKQKLNHYLEKQQFGH